MGSLPSKMALSVGFERARIFNARISLVYYSRCGDVVQRNGLSMHAVKLLW